MQSEWGIPEYAEAYRMAVAGRGIEDIMVALGLFVDETSKEWTEIKNIVWGIESLCGHEREKLLSALLVNGSSKPSEKPTLGSQQELTGVLFTSTQS